MRDAKREQEWSKRLVRVAEHLEQVEDAGAAVGLEGGVLDEVRVLFNTRDEADTLLVIKAHTETQKWVAFVGARNVGEAFLTWRQKDTGTGLKWREERPWGGK